MDPYVAFHLADVPTAEPDDEPESQIEWTSDLTVGASTLYNEAVAALYNSDHRIEVQVPAWANAGDEFHVGGHDGIRLSVIVPEGVGPGWWLEVWYGDPVLVVEVPEGAIAGQWLGVLVPNGRLINTLIPEGVIAGAQLTLLYDILAETLVSLD